MNDSKDTSVRCFFGVADCGIGLNFNNSDIISYIPEKYSIGLSKEFKKADNGIVYTTDSDCFDKAQMSKSKNILRHIKKDIEDSGLSVNNVVACYKEKRRNRLLIVFSSDNKIDERFYCNYSPIEVSDSICVSESYRSLITELKTIKSSSENFELWHPIINRPYRNRDCYLKAIILFAIHIGGLTAKQIIHISNLTVNLNASEKAVESYMKDLKRENLKTRSSMLSAEIERAEFDETERCALLTDWLYLISIGDYDEKQQYMLKTQAAGLLNIDKNTVYAVYNNIIKET